MKEATSSLLKKFGLTDDEILDIAIQERLREAIILLKMRVSAKWDMDTITAMKTVEALRDEFKT